MENVKISEKVSEVTYSLIKLAAYIILPLIAMVLWIIGSSAIVCGSIETSVDSIKGIIPTFIVFSFPMLLFLAAIPLCVKYKSEKKGLDSLGLIYKKSETNTTISIVNIGVLVGVIIRFLSKDNIILSDAISMIIHMIAIGISEEILLRVVIYDEVHKKFNTILSVIITSLIFAFISRVASWKY